MADDSTGEVEDTSLPELGGECCWEQALILVGGARSCLCHFLVQNKGAALILYSCLGVLIFRYVLFIKLPHLEKKLGSIISVNFFVKLFYLFGYICLSIYISETAYLYVSKALL